MTPSWETVLRMVESDVLRTEALLLAAAAPATDDVADRTLPPLTMMPSLPATLLERVEALRVRITQVRSELETAMRANRALLAETMAVRPPAQVQASRFVDTQA